MMGEMAEGGFTLADLEVQRNDISILLKQSLVKGEVRYLVDNRWFKQWKKYVGFDSWDASNAGEQSTYPGPIDNGPLFQDDGSGEIKDHLIDELDYVLLPKEAWDKLVSWYGVVEDQQPIIRNVIENGLYVKLCTVEIYLIELKLCKIDDLDNLVSRKFSKIDTIDHLESVMRELFSIPEDKETRLWNCYTLCTFEPLPKKDLTIHDAALYQGQVIAIEQKNDDGTWSKQVKNNPFPYRNSGCSEGKPSTGTSITTRYGTVGGCYGSYSYNECGIGDVQPGLCGLSNLGNTCFMNSALQCMSNTPPITTFFLEDEYWDQLNTENPLGMKGEIAKAYGDLAKIMWSGKYTCTAPRQFKMQVGRFAPQFSGYQQQDSQELLAFLLDGLHEDLNRIKKKPYIELRDADGRPDEEVAEEAWNTYRKRNDSIIVDIFHGLLKSTLVCPECSKVSVTFDPFCYLTLPLPIKKERHVEVLFNFNNDDSLTMQYKVTVPKAGNINDLCVALSRVTEVPANKMIVTDVYNHKFHKIFQPEENLSNITDRDCIVVYEVPVTSVDDVDVVTMPVYLRLNRDESKAGYCLFGHPLIVSVPRLNCTYEMLYNAILHRMKRYVHVPSSDDDWLIKNNENYNREISMSNGDDDDDNDPHLDEKDDDEGFDTSEELDSHSIDDNKNQYLFSMRFVNSAGSSVVDRIKDDGQHIKFPNRPYLAIDWHSKTKDRFYNEKQADEVEQHESMSIYNRTSIKRQVIQLSECLELYTATERLSAEDSWYCPGCKKHQQATKKFDLWSLPQVLVLCFKRFSYNRYLRDKIDTLVDFPIKGLNMAPYIINKKHGPVTYDLIAVSNHYGGLGGGHYTAYAKNKDDNKWYNFDDSSVTPIKEEAVVSKGAYVLFYMRRDAKENVKSSVPREIPAALGTPIAQDNGITTSSDEDCSMDTN